jgi:hypothetical protein
MTTESDYGLTPEQYHAGLNKLWEALKTVNYNGEFDVFTMCLNRIQELELAIVNHKSESQEIKDYTRFPAYSFENTKLWQVIE